MQPAAVHMAVWTRPHTTLLTLVPPQRPGLRHPNALRRWRPVQLRSHCVCLCHGCHAHARHRADQGGEPAAFRCHRTPVPTAARLPPPACCPPCGLVRTAGAGVSSSASIVCSSALAIMTALGVQLSQQVAPSCTEPHCCPSVVPCSLWPNVQAEHLRPTRACTPHPQPYPLPSVCCAQLSRHAASPRPCVVFCDCRRWPSSQPGLSVTWA